MSQPETKQPTPENPVKSVLSWKLSFLDFCALVLILLLLLMFFPRRLWFVELLSNLIHWLLLPSLPILTFMLIKRRWRDSVLWGIPALVFLILFGGLFLPSFAPEHTCDPGAPGSCTHLRVMTWNLFGILQADRQAQIDLIRNSGADIIALQEVSLDSEAAIEAQLSDMYPYQILFPDGISGTGLLSKYPVSDDVIFKTDAGILCNTKAVVDVNGLEITVFSVHPPPPIAMSRPVYESRSRDEIIALIRMTSDAGPVLLMGDFNISDQSPDYDLLTNEGLHDAFRDTGWGFGSTWPANNRFIGKFLPFVRIDYIWHTPDFQSVNAWTGPRAVSDHLPVIADLVYVQ